MRAYLKTKYNWTHATLNNIYWPSIKAVCQHLSHTKRMQTCKIMHGWLPVSHMRQHITGINQCPGCECTDETLDHFLKCPHLKITEQRGVILAQMRLKGYALKIPKNMLNAITQTLTTYTNPDQNNAHIYTPEIATALHYQGQIGFDMMARGFLSSHWLHAIHPSRHPPCVMVQLQ